jgi:hypothetical protein
MKKIVFALSLTSFLLVAAACGSNSDAGKVIKSAPVGNLTATLSNEAGRLKHGGDEFFITFKDASGKPVDAGAVALTFHMAGMGSMAEMNDHTTFTTTNTPGVYRGKANVEMAGEWQAQITYEGQAGRGQASFPINVQ